MPSSARARSRPPRPRSAERQRRTRRRPTRSSRSKRRSRRADPRLLNEAPGRIPSGGFLHFPARLWSAVNEHRYQYQEQMTVRRRPGLAASLAAALAAIGAIGVAGCTAAGGETADITVVTSTDVYASVVQQLVVGLPAGRVSVSA